MDMTEAFRNEDLSKTDFFDFVVAPDVSENQQAINFNRTLKSMGIFIDGPNNNNNNNNIVSNEFLGCKEEEEEQNNNHLMLTGGNDHAENIGLNSVVGNFVDHPFWASSCDKETVRIESAILEDLNKFCWTQEPDIVLNGTNNNNNNCHKEQMSLGGGNTDGAIYTLTVLNGDHASATWYRAPETTQLLKDDDTHSSHSHLNGNPQHTSLDLDSILSIIPNHPQNGHHYENGFETLTSLNNNDLMKSEYTYDDSGYATKDSTNGISHIIDSPILDTDTNFNNNNNDWKQSNNNNSTSADSLLRNALQGKSFLGRYNPSPKNGVKTPLDGHTELRRALNAPAGTKSPLDQSPVFIHPDEDMDMKHSPLLVLDQNTIIYDDVPVIGIADSDNPSSTHSMDDILLSQLDAASYPEDYEKLKRIANEVAESVNWSMDQTGSPQAHIYINAHVSNELGMTLSSPSAAPTKSKKYNRNKSNGTKAVAQAAQSNGIRKERSLHHCSICSKGFKDKYSVNVHIRTHTGEKPFACSLCGKSFRQKAHLAKHYQTHIAQKNAAAAAGAAGAANGTAKVGSKRFASAKTAA